MIADLDTLLVALYVELTDQIIPARRPGRHARPGRPATVTDAELVCLAVAQVLLRSNDEHHWLRAAPSRVGHLFPRLLSQPEYNRRLRGAADLLEDTLRWLATHTPATTELLRLVDRTPVPCGASRTTARRSELFGYAGYGRDTSHHRFYWGANLLLVVTCEGTTTGFGLANPKLAWTSPLRQDTSVEWRMSAWKTDSKGTGAGSPPSSSVTRWSWCAPVAGRSPRSPGSWGSMTRPLATGCARTASTVASKTG